MKTRIFLVLVSIAIASYIVVSCEKDNDDSEKPVIFDLEVGHDDTLHVGEDVHIEFKVSDNEKLDYYTIHIHEEGGHEKSASEEEEWEFDSTFTEISGLKNFTVHHDNYIKVPEHAHHGEYHFDLTVVDQAGNSTSVERDVIVEEGDGGHHHDH